jgi:hypothetical protein
MRLLLVAMCMLVLNGVYGQQTGKTELDKLLTDSGYTKIPLDVYEFGAAYGVNVVLDGQKATMLLDTGSEINLVLCKGIATKLKIDTQTHSYVDSSNPSFKSKKYGYGRVEGLKFADADFSVDYVLDAHGSDGLELNVRMYDVKKKEIITTKFDGLFGQPILYQHHAIVDSTSHSLYLKKNIDVELPKLQGDWIASECVVDGVQVKNIAELSFSNHTAKFKDSFHEAKGELSVTRDERTPGFYMHAVTKDVRSFVLKGIYQVSKDSLKLCIVDERSDISKKSKWVEGGESFPYKFEAKKGSSFIYYQFKRKPAEKSK